MNQENLPRAILRFYSAINLGDDLFVKLIADRYQNEFYIHGDAKRKVFRNFDNLIASQGWYRDLLTRAGRLIGRSIPIAPAQNYQDSNLLIYVGGSIFIEGDSIEKWRNERTAYSNLRIPYYILGSNFGPYKSTEFKTLVEEIIAGSSDTCFRDEASYGEFSHLPNVRLSPDLAFSHPSSLSASASSKTAIISVIETRQRLENSHSAAYDAFIRSCIEKLLSEGYNVTLMSFCRKQGDERAIKRILNMLTKDQRKQLTKYFYRGNLDEALSVIQDADVVVGSRFHATILGMVFGKKTLPLAYSDKTINMLSDLSYQGPFIDIRQLDELEHRSIDFDGLPIYDVSNQQVMSQSHFEKLDRVLKRK